MTCLGVSTIEDLYELINHYEGGDFVKTLKEYIHGRHEASVSQTKQIQKLGTEEKRSGKIVPNIK